MWNWHWISIRIRLQYRSLLVNLRWAFPQAIVPWIVTLLFADDIKAARGYGPLCIPLLLYSPFALIGIVLMMLAVAGYRVFSEKSAAVVRELFSAENILSVLIALAPLIYLLGNVLGDKPDSIGFAVIDYRPAPTLYFCFVLTFLVYSAAIFSHCKRDILFYLVNATLLILPAFTFGLWNDLSLNVSIPAILLLMVLVVKTLFAYMKRRRQCRKKLVVLAALLACGSITSLCDLASVGIASVFPSAPETTAYESLTLNDWARRDGTLSPDQAYNYFTYDYTDCLFYNVLAKK